MLTACLLLKLLTSSLIITSNAAFAKKNAVRLRANQILALKKITDPGL